MRRVRRLGSALSLALVIGILIAGWAPAGAAGFAVTEGQPIGSTVVVGTFIEGCVSEMTCLTFAPDVQSIVWGDSSTTTPSACNVNSDTPGSSCWLTESCAPPPTGCTFSLFAPGHVFAEEGTYTGSFLWSDQNGPKLVTTTITAAVAAAPFTSATGEQLNASEGQPFSGLLAKFTDAAPGDHSGDMSGTVDWGDGSPANACGPAATGDPCVIQFAAGVYSVTAGHMYGTAGTHSPTIVINDRGGTQAQAHATVTVVGPPPVGAPPPGPLAASVAGVSTSGPSASVTIACQGPAGQTCLGSVTLTVRERKRGRSVVAVSAAGRPKVRTTTVTVTAGHASFAVAVGHRATLQIGLSSTARRLLATFYRLPVRLTLAGSGAPARTVTFSYPKITSGIFYTIEFTAGHSTVLGLSISGLPKGAVVTVDCRGRGCPAGRRLRRPDGGSLSLTGVFARARLAPHTRLEISVTALNRVGKVLILTVQSNSRPAQVIRCLPPGARKPQACA